MSKIAGNSVISTAIIIIPKNKNINFIPIVNRITITTIAAIIKATKAKGP